MAACASSANPKTILRAAKCSSAARATRGPWPMRSSASDPSRSCLPRTSHTRFLSTTAWKRSTKSSSDMTSRMPTKKRYLEKTPGAFIKSRSSSMIRDAQSRLSHPRRTEMPRRLCCTLAFLVLLAAPVSSIKPATALDKIKFPYSPISYHSLPFLVAYEARLFEKHGLEVDPVFAGASSLIVQSMLAGEADLAGMAGPAVISNVLKGGDVVQVAALVKSFSVPLYVQPSITQIAQLSGKRVGVTRFGSVSHFTAKAVLDRSNVTDAVIVQTGGYPESMTALTTNAIAGAMIPAPQSVVLREKGFRELVSIKQIRDMNIRFIEQGIVARRAYAEKNADLVKRFIEAVYDGLKKIHDDKAFAIKVLGKYTKVTRPAMLDESYQAGIDAFAKDPRVPPEVFKDLSEQLVGLKLIDAAAAQKTPVTSYYDNRYVDELERSGFFKRLWQ